MKTKFFLTGLVMAAVVFVSCGRSNQSKASLDKEETSKASVMTVQDNKLFINSDLYNISEEHVISVLTGHRVQTPCSVLIILIITVHCLLRKMAV